MDRSIALKSNREYSKKPSGKLHILFVTGSMYEKSSGPSLSVLETAKALVKKGHSSIVVGSKDRWTDKYPSAWEPVPVYAFRKIGPYSLHCTPGLAVWLHKLEIPVQVASLQGVWLYNNYLISRWCRKRGIPIILSVRGNFNSLALGVSRWKKKLARLWFANELLANVSCFHALNYAEYQAIRSYGLKQPVCIIPNGVSLPALNTDVPDVRSEYNLTVNKICLYLGRLHPIKGLENLIHAWAKISKDINVWKLVLAGPSQGGFQTKLETLANQLDCKNDIFFVGPQYGRDKAAWFKSADFFILPSKSEGLAMTPLEAMSHGLPVMLTEACNLNEVVDSIAGIVVGSSADDLEIGLREMMSMSDDERKSIGHLGYHLVKRDFQWGRIADQLLDVYRWILGQSDVPLSVVLD